MSRAVLSSPDVPTAEPEKAEFDQLLTARPAVAGEAGSQNAGVRVGTLVAFAGDGTRPLVTFAGQAGTAAMEARATVDLHGAHVGREVVLVFEGGDANRPIIIGCVRGDDRAHEPEAPGRVEVDADGERMIVSAKDQLVLRCGQASITLTRAGKILLHGTYVSNRSSGVLRLKGGSVQIN